MKWNKLRVYTPTSSWILFHSTHHDWECTSDYLPKYIMQIIRVDCCSNLVQPVWGISMKMFCCETVRASVISCIGFIFYYKESFTTNYAFTSAIVVLGKQMNLNHIPLWGAWTCGLNYLTILLLFLYTDILITWFLKQWSLSISSRSISVTSFC